MARELEAFGVVNVGATGTFVVNRPGKRGAFDAELRRRLPFTTEIVLCDAQELIQIASLNPFEARAPKPDLIPFVRIFSSTPRSAVTIPYSLPSEEEWFVRAIGLRGKFAFGLYRRHMRTIRYLDQLDRAFGGAGTTRRWSTIEAVLRLLKAARTSPAGGRNR